MSAAHPMIQPTDWSVEPEALRGQWPGPRVDLYQIVWDTALACTLPPPRLLHTRAVAAGGEAVVAVAGVEAEPTARGYWALRTDEPAFRWPVNRGATPPASATVTTATAVKGRLPLAGLIGHAAAAGCGTPASLASHLQALLAEDRLIEGDAGPAGDVHLTPAGAVALTSYRLAGRPPALPALAALRDAVARVAAADALPADALAACGVPRDRAAVLGAAIDADAQAWAGTPQRAALAAQALAGITPPRVRLPAALDPERLLPADDPLRALREEMERALFGERADWPLLSPNEQAEERRAWLLEHTPAGIALPRLEGPYWRLDALALWLVSVDHD